MAQVPAFAFNEDAVRVFPDMIKWWTGLCDHRRKPRCVRGATRSADSVLYGLGNGRWPCTITCAPNTAFLAFASHCFN